MKLRVGHESMLNKTYEYDLDCNDKDHTGVISVRHTSTNGDTPMCKSWYANVKAKRSDEPETKLLKTDGQKNRQTHRQSDSCIPPELCLQVV